jgi:hypothetical protein
MAEIALVDEDVRRADLLVETLEKNGFPLVAALWLYQSDADRWRFVVSPEEHRADPTSFYRDFAKLLRSADPKLELLDLNKVDIVKRDSPILTALGKLCRVEGKGRARITDSSINGIFIEDALVYKLCA